MCRRTKRRLSLRETVQEDSRFTLNRRGLPSPLTVKCIVNTNYAEVNKQRCCSSLTSVTSGETSLIRWEKRMYVYKHFSWLRRWRTRITTGGSSKYDDLLLPCMQVPRRHTTSKQRCFKVLTSIQRRFNVMCRLGWKMKHKVKEKKNIRIALQTKTRIHDYREGSDVYECIRGHGVFLQ